MATTTERQRVEQQDILTYLIQILHEVTEDWDVGEITARTLLGDLGLESISLVYFIGEIQQHYDLQDKLFEKLRAGKANLNSLPVANIVSLVSEVLRTSDVVMGDSP